MSESSLPKFFLPPYGLVAQLSFAPLYFVSTAGKVYSIAHGEWREMGIGRKRGNYPTVVICHAGKQTTYCVHQLMATTFLGPAPSAKHQVRHLDGDKQNNVLDNLAWGTAKDNAADSKRHGTKPQGVKHPATPFEEADVLKIRQLFHGGMTQTQIARQYRVSQAAIWAITRRRTWKHLP